MEKNLVDMFKGLNDSYRSLESRLKAEGFKVRIMKIFRTWEEWAVYGRDFLIKLQNTFLGLSTKESKDDRTENVDGVPLSDKEDEDLDGVPLDGAALLKGALMRGIPTPEKEEHSDYDDDIDGVPCKMTCWFLFRFYCYNFFQWMKILTVFLWTHLTIHQADLSHQNGKNLIHSKSHTKQSLHLSGSFYRIQSHQNRRKYLQFVIMGTAAIVMKILKMTAKSDAKSCAKSNSRFVSIRKNWSPAIDS